MKQDKQVGGFLLTWLVFYMILGAFGLFFIFFPPEGSEPKFALIFPYLGLFLFSISLMKFQSMGYFGLILTHVLMAGMWTYFFHDKQFSIDPLEFVSIMSSKWYTWLCAFSVLILWMGVRPIGKQLE